MCSLMAIFFLYPVSIARSNSGARWGNSLQGKHREDQTYTSITSARTLFRAVFKISMASFAKEM